MLKRSTIYPYNKNKWPGKMRSFLFFCFHQNRIHILLNRIFKNEGVLRESYMRVRKQCTEGKGKQTMSTGNTSKCLNLAYPQRGRRLSKFFRIVAHFLYIARGSNIWRQDQYIAVVPP